MIDVQLHQRIRDAWHRLSEARKTVLHLQVQTAHDALISFLETRRPPRVRGVRHELVYAHSILNPLEGALVLSRAFALALEEAAGSFTPPIDEYGDIWGFGRYELLDFRWAEALLSLLWNLTWDQGARFPFDAMPAVWLQYPASEFTLGVIADWGTGNWYSQPEESPSASIAKWIETVHRPNMVIHLGDVYYAGSTQEERNHLLDAWPVCTDWNFTLNSNHEMYPGGLPYFNSTLADPKFARQGQRSCFVIETPDWLLVGLDSAYYSDPTQLYMGGALWPLPELDPLNPDPVPLPPLPPFGPQAELLQAVHARVLKTGKQVMVFTHHDPLNFDGSAYQPLRHQLMQVVSSGVAYWYYGHTHIGAAYTPKDGTSYRCVGHGSLPWAYASDLDHNEHVDWFERTPIPGSPTNRVANGFAILSFSGKQVTERFYTEFNGLSHTAGSDSTAL